MEEYARVIFWFGKVHDPNKERSFLDRIEYELSKKSFHGPVNANTATKMMKSKGAGQYYLIRFSGTVPGAYAITFSKPTTGQQGVYHIRIFSTEEGKLYFTNQDKQYETIEDMVEEIVPGFTPIEGSRYNQMSSTPYIPYVLNDWISDNQDQFHPPVCNKLMYKEGQLKVMFVGGPNTRDDYHVEDGEEIFWMVQGDMCLKIMERGVPKDVVIREGEVFLLPAHVPHSPQRNADTVGLVVERERAEDELDCLRWYTDGFDEVLYEEWFHCDDLGVDLPPVIQRYHQSEQYTTRVPVPGFVGEPKFKIDEETVVTDPFSLADWIEERKENIPEEGISVFPEKQEFQFRLFGSLNKELVFEDQECLYWVWSGSATVTKENETAELETSSFFLLQKNERHTIATNENTLLLQLVTIPRNYQGK
eukprot:TRINITY_DN5604_c0_g1_i1.p1 TRINITY_DN5604_c0_g1~~TRINITY_DN5604_c0_g1_i1.p1  ORF type:complete len:420 (+),score=94.39 TRINITY_DN5604_c0_g1_i1:1371-2630(+)